METNTPEQLSLFFSIFRISALVYLAFALGCLVLAVKLLERLSLKIQGVFPSQRLHILQFTTILSFFLYIGGGLFLFYAILNPPKELLLAVGGSAAVAIGFSLKDLVGSVIAGVVVLFDRPFQVGDRVKFGDVYGDIVSIGLRATRLRTLDDSMVTVPNARFFTDLVSSGNAGALDMMIEVPFYVALDADVDRAKELAYECVVTSRFVYLKKPARIVLSEESVAGRLAIKLTIKAYVLDVALEKAFQTDLVVRIARTFKKYGIKRPELLPFGDSRDQIPLNKN
ncbi:MAG: mechanosensitive ion channel [Bdellovibrionales bacterium]|nr:mechanosensitive ion channel [Bdellovibrionales bacterium]